MDHDIKANGWGIKKITDANNAEDFMTIFQTFYQLTGRLPLTLTHHLEKTELT